MRANGFDSAIQQPPANIFWALWIYTLIRFFIDLIQKTYYEVGNK
jgi:hypothetical protein